MFVLLLPFKIPKTLNSDLPIKTVPVMNEKFNDYRDAKLKVTIKNNEIINAKLEYKPIIQNQRVGYLDGETLVFNKNNKVKNLYKIQNSVTYLENRKIRPNSNVLELNIDTELKKPINIKIVPPGAILEDKNGENCVWANNKPYLINIISSELGKSLIQIKNNTNLTEVSFMPSENLLCQKK
jgi:hypothetical protein